MDWERVPVMSAKLRVQIDPVDRVIRAGLDAGQPGQG
jgi:hypothetical protein